MQVLREHMGWPPSPYQWATAGYGVAIGSGKVTCGVLVGASIFLGYLHGRGAHEGPQSRGQRRQGAIAAVHELYQEFIDRFGDTDCRTLCGCDFSLQEDRVRYREEAVMENVCLPYYRHVLVKCLDNMAPTNEETTDNAVE